MASRDAVKAMVRDLLKRIVKRGPRKLPASAAEKRKPAAFRSKIIVPASVRVRVANAGGNDFWLDEDDLE